MPAFSGFLSSSFMTLIQEFWFGALAVADRIAMSPLPPICSLSIFTSSAPMVCTEAWLMKSVRASLATSESCVTTLMPLAAACFSAGATASGSLPAMMMASGFCWIVDWMIGTCVEAPASVGPLRVKLPPTDVMADLVPLSSMSSYGLPSCFGIWTTLMPFLIGAFGFALAASLLPLDAAALVDVVLLSLVSPHAVAKTERATTAAEAAESRKAR